MANGVTFGNTPIRWSLELQPKTTYYANHQSHFGSPKSYLRERSIIRFFPSLDILILAFESFAYTTQIRYGIIYIIITKNIRYLLWNRWAWRFFHDTYLTIEVQGVRCTNHLLDSCPFTDVNPHFTAPECRYYFKINSWWPIVTS